MRTASGRSCLMACVIGDSALATEWFLEAWTTTQQYQSNANNDDIGDGDILEQRTYAGYGALWWACFDGKEQAARVLLAKGADDHAVDINGR